MWWARLLNVISGLLAGGVAASTNSYESISTVTVGAGGSATVTFSSIPSTYKHLQIRCFGRVQFDGNLIMRLNNDTGANYSWHQVYGTGAVAGASSGASSSLIYLGSEVSTANIFGVSIVDILDYADTNKYKTIRSLDGYDANGSGVVDLASGSWRSTSAVSSIQFTAASSGNFQQYSSFALYGIK